MRKTFMYKLYRCKQSRRLHQMINIGGVIHNHCIALHRRYYRRFKKSLSLYQLKAHITRLKKLAKYAFWSLLGSQVIQEIVIRIDKGYQRFFANVKDRKAGKTVRRIGPPSFRKVRKAKSFTLTQAGWKLIGANRLRIGNTVYKFAKSREIDGVIKTVTIKRDTLGDLYVYFSCLLDEQPIARAMTGHSAGFDFGLTTYLTGSDGTDIVAPQPFKRSLKTIARANRSLAHKVKDSHNRRHAQQHLARTHKRVGHQREAFHWDTARALCLHYDMIALETLNLQGMKALWGRKVSDLGFASFVDILHHVATKTGTIIQHISPWFPSTKLCAVCGCINQAITLRDRTWTCPDCGAVQQRDRNAALNIFREGASSHGGDLVSLVSASRGC